jgi:hypothetical protein
MSPATMVMAYRLIVDVARWISVRLSGFFVVVVVTKQRFVQEASVTESKPAERLVSPMPDELISAITEMAIAASGDVIAQLRMTCRTSKRVVDNVVAMAPCLHSNAIIESGLKFLINQAHTMDLTAIVSTMAGGTYSRTSDPELVGMIVNAAIDAGHSLAEHESGPVISIIVNGARDACVEWMKGTRVCSRIDALTKSRLLRSCYVGVSLQIHDSPNMVGDMIYYSGCVAPIRRPARMNN